MQDIKKIDQDFIANTYARSDVVFVRGKGSILFDANKKKYIDFSSGIAVNGLGHANKAWIKAVQSQVETLAHASNLYYTEPCALLAKELIARTGMSKVFFSNSGAEANECAFKSARKYAVDKGKTARPEIVTLTNSFHGRTMMTLTATGQDAMHKSCFKPFMDGFRYANANDMDSVRKVVNKNTAAIVLELIQGEGGVNVLERAFVTAVAEMCREMDILLIIDEVQTGNGRTGTLFVYMQYGLTPDIVTTAKGLGNGLPIGATLFGQSTKSVLSASDHGSTFGGNPVACAGALAVLEQIDDELLNEVSKKSDYIRKELQGVTGVGGVSGIGLMLGVAVKDAKAVRDRCLERGLVVLTAHEKLRLLPPLNIKMNELIEGVEILKGVLNETLS